MYGPINFKPPDNASGSSEFFVLNPSRHVCELLKE